MKRRFDLDTEWFSDRTDDILFGWLNYYADWNGEFLWVSWEDYNTIIKKKMGLQQRTLKNHLNALVNNSRIVLIDGGIKIIHSEGSKYVLVERTVLGKILDSEAPPDSIRVFVYLLDKYNFKRGYSFTTKEVVSALGYTSSLVATRIGDVFRFLRDLEVIGYSHYYDFTYTGPNAIAAPRMRLSYVAKAGNKEIVNPNIGGCGVYGIYLRDELVYIGSTVRPFEERWDEHKRNILKKSKSQQIYEVLGDAAIEDIDFRVLIDVGELPIEEKMEQRDIEVMEMLLITQHQPRGNVAGMDRAFLFSKR